MVRIWTPAKTTMTMTRSRVLFGTDDVVEDSWTQSEIESKRTAFLDAATKLLKESLEKAM